MNQPNSQGAAPQDAEPNAEQSREEAQLSALALEAGVASYEFAVFKGDTILFHTADSSELIEWGQKNKPGPVRILCPSPSPALIVIVGDKEDSVIKGIIEHFRAHGITEYVPPAASQE